MPHPDQVEPANRIFRPSEEEVRRVTTIVAAFDWPDNRGVGVLAVDGQWSHSFTPRWRRVLVRAAAAT